MKKKKTLAKGPSHPQELEEGLHSGPYLLPISEFCAGMVSLKTMNSKIDFFFFFYKMKNPSCQG